MPENGNSPHIPNDLPSYLAGIRAQLHETVARSRAILEECKPDTFLAAGRKIPFPRRMRSKAASVDGSRLASVLIPSARAQ